MPWKSDLKALKDLSRSARSNEDFEAVVNALDTQNDIAVALLCSALIEEATEDFLSARVVKLGNEERGELFRGTAPLSTLSARTKVAYAPGAIGPITRKNINAAREIRNAFAHPGKSISFKTPEIAAVCRHIDFKSQSSLFNK